MTSAPWIFHRTALRLLSTALAAMAIALAFAFAWAAPASAQESEPTARQGPPVLIGFDGAYGVKNATSARAIELGIRAAIDEINAQGGVLNGRPLELVTKDNRSVPARGIANLEAFAAMDDLVAVFGGRFSPVILQQLATLHANEIIMLNVWGAADGITEHDHQPSYTFRLSLKDSWAMPAMVNHARNKGAREVGVLLPNTGWGRSNEKALADALAETPDVTLVETVWYNWGERDMLRHYKRLLGAGAQAVLLVGNDLETSTLVRQLGADADTARVPIVSHWGVTGGNMVEASGPTLLEMDFSVVQTFSFFTARPGPRATFEKTVQSLTNVADVTALPSPVGTGHAYDMTHLLAMAIERAGTTARAKVRDALETLPRFEGLVRIYDPAFTATDHEALGPEDVFLARYRADGVLVPLDLD